MKKLFAIAVLAVTMAFGAVTGSWADGTREHRVAIHVDSSDPKVMNLALNNAKNVDAYYKSKGETIIIEVVTYGPGLNMLIPGKSPVETRVATMSLEMDNLSFAACANTKAKMEAKTGKTIQIMDEAKIVPSGVVRLIELQEAGYAYVRP